MKVIAIANQKGGTAKTTAAINISEGLGRRNYKVLLADLDKQESSSDWAHINDHRSFDFKTIFEPTKLKDFIKQYQTNYDYIILDCPPGADAIAAQIMKNSTLVLIPNGPSPVEIWALSRFIDVVRDRQKIQEGKPLARILLSRCILGTKLVPKSVKACQDLELEIMQSGTIELEAYKQVFGHGGTVFSNSKELGGERINTKPCVEQIEAIVSEILELLGDQSKERDSIIKQLDHALLSNNKASSYEIKRG